MKMEMSHNQEFKIIKQILYWIYYESSYFLTISYFFKVSLV